MFKFLLVAFLIFSDGDVRTVKAPMSSEQQCVSEANKLLKRATAEGVIMIGTCVTPNDYRADT